MNFIDPTNSKIKYVRKFGRNQDIDTTSDPESIWSVGTPYTGWAASATTTTVVSTSTDDDGDPDTNTGAHTVTIEGLDANYKEFIATYTLDGTTTVAVGTDLLRCHRMYIASAGSGATNAGNVAVKHGSTVLSQIDAEIGQTLQATYTTPKTDKNGLTYESAWLLGYSATLTKNTNAAVELEVMFRPENGVWRVLETFGLVQAGASTYAVNFASPVSLGTGTDIELVCRVTSANDASISGQFDIALVRA